MAERRRPTRHKAKPASSTVKHKSPAASTGATSPVKRFDNHNKSPYHLSLSKEQKSASGSCSTSLSGKWGAFAPPGSPSQMTMGRPGAWPVARPELQ